MEIEHEIETESASDPKNNVKNIEMCLSRISHDAAAPSRKFFYIITTINFYNSQFIIFVF